jgi:hypothetical protein
MDTGQASARLAGLTPAPAPRRAGRNAAHCPGRPSSLNGAPRPHSARTRLRRAVDPGASVDPAGLPVRARPEAGPEACAANLREGRDISPGFACLKILGEPA